MSRSSARSLTDAWPPAFARPLRSHLTGLGLAIVDQAVFSLANLVAQILIARALGPAPYGAVAIAFSAFLFVSGFHNALVLEPMSVFAPSLPDSETGRYLRSLIRLHFAVVVAVAAMIAAGAMFVTEPSLATALIGGACATPFILSIWFARRAAYALHRTALALRASASYALCLVAILSMLGLFGRVSITTAFAAIATSSFLACLLAWRFPVTAQPDISTSSDPFTATFMRHWTYGRWIVGSALVHWLSGPAYVPLLGAASSVENSGAFRAAQNLVLPMQHALVGIGLYLLPSLARRRARGDLNVTRTVPGLILALGGTALLYGALLLAFAPTLIDLFYGAGNFETALSVIPYFAAGVLVHGISAPLALTLRAVERPAALFRAHAAGSLVTATAGAYLVSSRGLVGAAEGSLLASLVTAGAMALSLRSLARNDS